MISHTPLVPPTLLFQNSSAVSLGNFFLLYLHKPVFYPSLATETALVKVTIAMPILTANFYSYYLLNISNFKKLLSIFHIYMTRKSNIIKPHIALLILFVCLFFTCLFVCFIVRTFSRRSTLNIFLSTNTMLFTTGIRVYIRALEFILHN